jgi:lauroyl/myristoyl acyltransferase
VPASAVSFVVDGLGDVCAVTLRTRRRVIFGNLMRTAPDRASEHPALVRQTFRNMIRCSADLMRLPLLSRDELAAMFDVQGREHLDRATAAGHGVIVVSGHLGNWELGSAWIAAHGYRLHAVVEDGPGQEDRVEGYRPYRTWIGTRLIPLTRSGLAIRRVLLHGELLGLAADRALGTASAVVEFCGGRRRLPTGPARLARVCGSSVVLAHFIMHSRQPQRYIASFQTVDRAHVGDADAFTQLIADRLSRVVRAYPDQWFVFQPDWLEDDRRSQIS